MPISSSLYPHVRKAWDNVRFRGKTDQQIAYETGVSEDLVARARAICTGKTNPGGRPPLLSPAEIDWTKSNAQISREVGVCAETVRATRRLLRKPSSRRRGCPKGLMPSTLKRFADVDWDMIDEAIAIEVGVSRQRVHQIRKALKIPKAPKITRQNVSDAWVAKNLRRIPNMTTSQAVAESGLCRQTLTAAAKRHGVRFSTFYSGRPWHLFNWDLPNSDLADIWGISDPPSGGHGMRVALTRSRLKMPKSRWDRRFGKVPSDALYKQAIHQETKRASAWRKGQEIFHKEQSDGV